MATHKVSNSSQLDLAFDNARPGDIIELAPGTYGRLYLDGATKADAHLKFDTEVTVTSASSSNPAVFTGMLLNKVENLTFKGVKFDYGSAVSDQATNFTVQYSNGIAFRNAIFEGAFNGTHGTGTGLKVKDSDDISVVGSRFDDLYSGVKFNGGHDVEVLNSTFRTIAYDGLTFAGIDNLLVAGNDVETKTDPAARHKDLIQLVNGGTNPASNVVIRDNLLKADDSHTHGIYMGNEGARYGSDTSKFYQNVLIANNVIYSGHQLGIALGETVDGEILNNKVLQHSSMGGSTKTGNIPAILVDDDSRGIKVSGNTTHATPKASDYWSVEDTPSAWAISGNTIVRVGTTTGTTAPQIDLNEAPEPSAPGGSSRTLSGTSGADSFRFDGANLAGSQTTVLSGVDFTEDEIFFIRYDAATFQAVTGGNKLANSSDGTYVRLESLLDVQEVVAASMAVTASANRTADTLAINVAQKNGVQTVVLDGYGKAYLDTYDADLF